MTTRAEPADGVPVRRRLAVAVGYGLVCHLSFATAVGVMAHAMFFGLSRCAGPLADPWAWPANLALLLQFPLAHSFLLSRPGRAVLRRAAPGGLGGDMAPTTYVILASLQTILLFGLWSPSGTVWWRAEGAGLVLLCCLYAAAWLLLAKSILDAGPSLQTGLLGWWAVLRGVRPTYPAMPTTGLFRLVRQPIYVAFALTLWTVPTWTPDQLVLALVLTGYCVAGPALKEARFRRLHGERFDAYRRAVPYWLPWPRPVLPAQPSAKSTSSFTFRAMMTAATSTASADTQRGAVNSPILRRSAVNITSGTTAKGS
jgi:protein-S-isoprenylcysteine O-methyltransferase Ste14